MGGFSRIAECVDKEKLGDKEKLRKVRLTKWIKFLKCVIPQRSGFHKLGATPDEKIRKTTDVFKQIDEHYQALMDDAGVTSEDVHVAANRGRLLGEPDSDPCKSHRQALHRAQRRA